MHYSKCQKSCNIERNSYFLLVQTANNIMCSRDSSSNAVMRVSTMSFGEIDDNMECIFHANIFLYAQDE